MAAAARMSRGDLSWSGVMFPGSEKPDPEASSPPGAPPALASAAALTSSGCSSPEGEMRHDPRSVSLGESPRTGASRAPGSATTCPSGEGAWRPPTDWLLGMPFPPGMGTPRAGMGGVREPWVGGVRSPQEGARRELAQENMSALATESPRDRVDPWEWEEGNGLGLATEKAAAEAIASSSLFTTRPVYPERPRPSRAG